MRLEYTYEANSKELTPAIPRRGLAIPAKESGPGISTIHVADLCTARRNPPFEQFVQGYP